MSLFEKLITEEYKILHSVQRKHLYELEEDYQDDNEYHFVFNKEDIPYGILKQIPKEAREDITGIVYCEYKGQYFDIWITGSANPKDMFAQYETLKTWLGESKINEKLIKVKHMKSKQKAMARKYRVKNKRKLKMRRRRFKMKIKNKPKKKGWSYSMTGKLIKTVRRVGVRKSGHHKH